MVNTTHSLAAPAKDIEFFNNLFKDDDKATINNIQRSLDLIFPEIIDLKLDGIIGTDTTKALNEFCSHFEIKQTDNLRSKLKAALYYYADMAKMEPTWKKDTSKQNFICWLNKQLDRHDTASPQKILNLEAPQRLILLKFFKNESQYLDSWSDSEINATAETKKTQRNRTDQLIVSYEITATDLKELETKNQILEQLHNLQDKEFSDKHELMAALKKVSEEVTDQNRHYDRYLTYILKRADKLTTYQLTEQLLIKLKFEKMPENILKLLRELRNVEYKTKDEFIKACENAIELGSEEDKNNSQYKKTIREYAHHKTICRLTEQSLVELKNENIPKKILEEIQRLEDIEYSSKELFFEALTALKYYNCLKRFLEHSEELDAFNKTEECFKVPKELVAYLSSIMSVARKEHSFDNSKSIEWSGGECGCVLEDLPFVVYGFYPFWLAGKQQTLDFSVLSRIGYYAVSLDERGNIIESLNWDKDSADFINIARDHRTKVDLVVHVDRRNEWPQPYSSAFDELTDNIVGLITEKIPNRLINKIKPVITFGRESVPAIGDGITLYFERPEVGDTDPKPSFVVFIKKLREKMKAAGTDYDLNILLPMDAVGKGLFSFENLEELIPDRKEIKYVDYFLVFLEEPTTDSKKKLRREIEDNFKGIQRRNMLRKIIPVTTPLTHTESEKGQLADDLIYFEDNFGGVGIWPLPLSTGQESKATEADDRTAKRAQVINDALQKGTAQVYEMCKFVCPHRWYFRIAWNLSLVILAILCLCYFISCKVRYVSHSYRKYSGFILATTLLLLILLHVVLLECDPYRSLEITDSVTIIGGVVYLAALVILVQLFGRKGKQP
jgi:hypothetical protein